MKVISVHHNKVFSAERPPHEALNIMEVTRQEQVYIYLFQKFNEFKGKGLLVGGNLQVNPEKLSLIEGFEPTEQEIHEAMNVLEAQGYIKGLAAEMKR